MSTTTTMVLIHSGQFHLLRIASLSVRRHLYVIFLSTINGMLHVGSKPGLEAYSQMSLESVAQSIALSLQVSLQSAVKNLYPKVNLDKLLAK